MSYERIIPSITEGKNAYVEYFDSLLEFVEDVYEKKDSIPKDGNPNRHLMRAEEWSGNETPGGEFKNWEELKELALGGYNRIVPAIRENSDRIGFEQAATGYEKNITGFAPIIDRALIGYPDAMAARKPNKRKIPVVNIYYNTTAVCSIKSCDMQKAAERFFAAIKGIELMGIRIRLDIGSMHFGLNEKNDIGINIIPVKAPDRPTSIQRYAFALCHPAFLRMFNIQWVHNNKNLQPRSGTSRVYYYSGISNEQAFKTLFPEKKNTVVFSVEDIIYKDEREIYEILKNKCMKNINKR